MFSQALGALLVDHNILTWNESDLDQGHELMMSHHRWVTKVLVGLQVENPQKALWTITFMIVFGEHYTFAPQPNSRVH